MRTLDFHEFVGALIPGVILVAGLGLTFPEIKREAFGEDFSVGDLGIATLVSYALGHLIQAIGNGIEKCWWWLFGGMPTDWVRGNKREIISPEQRALLQNGVRNMIKSNTFQLGDELRQQDWASLTRQIYSVVYAAGQTARIDVFSGNYGLSRGLTAALLVLLIVLATGNVAGVQIIVIAIALAAMAMYRMHRFGVAYARELFVQFLQTIIRET